MRLASATTGLTRSATLRGQQPRARRTAQDCVMEHLLYRSWLPLVSAEPLMLRLEPIRFPGRVCLRVRFTALLKKYPMVRTRLPVIGKSPGCLCLSSGGIFPRLSQRFLGIWSMPLSQQGGLPGILANCHASGTAVIREVRRGPYPLGQTHLLHLCRFRHPDRRA